MVKKITEVVNVDFKLLVWLDEYAERYGITRSEAMERAIRLLQENEMAKKNQVG